MVTDWRPVHGVPRYREAMKPMNNRRLCGVDLQSRHLNYSESFK